MNEGMYTYKLSEWIMFVCFFNKRPTMLCLAKKQKKQQQKQQPKKKKIRVASHGVSSERQSIRDDTHPPGP